MRYRILFLAFVLFSLSVGAWGQSLPSAGSVIKGRVLAADGSEPIIGASVVLNPSDSLSSYRGRTAVSDVNGNFQFTVSGRKYKELEIEYLGYSPLRKEFTMSGGVTNLGTLYIEPEAMRIERLVVTAESVSAQLKGDTLQYNAAAYKTNPDATSEDLLKKLPGIVTEADGTIKSQGQAIAKVYVNGKEFFDDDPSLALKTLAADAVQSIQMYDDLSEDAKFSGFDDGTRVRSINITTSAGVETSTFGKAYAGYGTDGRYAAGLGLNIFNGDHRFTLIGSGDNVNSQGFTLMDVMSSSGRGRGRMRNAMGNLGADLSSYKTTTRGGVRETQMAGLNYNGEFSKRFKMSASYFFSHRQGDNIAITERNYQTAPRFTVDSTATMGEDYSHNLRTKFEWTPNDNNIITFSPRIRYSTNGGSSLADNRIVNDDVLTNSSKNRYSTHLMNLRGTADLWWTHRFDKAGRTLSVGGVLEGNRAIGDRSQLSINPLLPADADTTLNQRGKVYTSGYSISGSATYSEPLSKRSRLSINYMIRYDRSFSDQQGLNYDKAAQDYALLDFATTNNFARNYTTHNAGLAYNFVLNKVFNLTANLNYQISTLNQYQSFYSGAEQQNIHSVRPFYAVLPGVNLIFNPKRTERYNQSLNLAYNTMPIMPSVTQLQDVLNVSNPLSASQGNPNLRQGYSHNVNGRYNLTDLKSSSSLDLSVGATASNDYIANHRRFLSRDTVVNGTTLAQGSQYTTPVNLDGYYNATFYGTYSMRINPIKSNLTLGLNYAFIQSPSIEDNVKYFTFNNAVGANVSLTSNLSDRVDFTLFYRPAVSFARSSKNSFDRYQTHDAGAFVNVFIVGGLYLNVDATWRNNFGTQAGYSQHYALVNAAVGYKFLKYQQAEFKVSVYDALAQNQSEVQSVADAYTQLAISNILPRHFMLSFTYKFDTRKGRTAASYGKGDRATRSTPSAPSATHSRRPY